MKGEKMTDDELMKKLNLKTAAEHTREVQVREFQTILADPPWLEQGGGKSKRGADKHYSLLKTKQIPKVMMEECPYWDQIAEIAHLYLWVTNNFLKDGLWVMEQLGFRYVTNLVWTKPSFGLGQYRRGQHEILLFGVKGRGIALRQSRKASSWIGQKEIKSSQHSKKPLETYETIEEGSPGPYLELFARSERENWQSWGNEI